MSGRCIVFVTCSGTAEAGKIAEALVSAKAAACVNIIPRVRSVYRWKGRINKSAEAMMVIKSRSGLYSKIERLVKKNHSYSCPEVISIAIARGSAPYLDWITKNTRGE